MLLLDHFGLTDAGKVRQNNEDDLLAGGDRDPALFAVADGIGGFEAGEVASSIAIESLQELDPEGSLESAIREANRRIHSSARESEKRSGMGTTVVAARISETAGGIEAEVAHVGDSRAYLLRDGDLTPLTEDHSLVAELVRSGSLTRAQASDHPQKNLITRALGAEDEVEVDSSRHGLRPGDRLVLCSDGLPDMVPEARMSELVSGDEARSAEDSARSLLSAALAAGGADNVTVVVVDVNTGPDQTTSQATNRTANRTTSQADETSILDPARAAGSTGQQAEPEATEVAGATGAAESAGDTGNAGEAEAGTGASSRSSGGKRRLGRRDRGRERSSGAYARLKEGESLIPGVWDGAAVEEEERREPTPEEVAAQFRVRSVSADPRETREDPKRRRRRKRLAGAGKAVSNLIRGLAVVALVGLLLVPPYLWWSTRYFMDYDNGEVVVYQGVPYDFLGNELNRVDQRTGVQESDISEPYQDRIRENRLYTQDRLQTVLDDLQKS